LWGAKRIMLTKKLLQLYIALMIGSQFNIGILYLVFVGYVVAGRMFARNKERWSNLELQYIFIAVLSVVLSFIYIVIYHEGYEDRWNIYLANRKIIIEIAFSLALYVYLKYKDLRYIIETIFYALLFNVIVGTIEIATGFPKRISMLFPEPSSAGYFYLFIFFIALTKLKEPPLYKYVSRYFLLIGLAIGSKAQIALLFFVGMLKYFTPGKILAYILIIGGLTYVFWDDLMRIEAFKYNLHVVEVYLEQGLGGFKEKEGIWGTYVTRISAIEGSIKCIIEHPFGVGFGGFNSWFPINMAGIGFSSEETDKIFQGVLYASSKSNLLWFFVSTGIFGIALYIYWFKIFWDARKEYEYLFQSFVALTLASTFIELNPMFLYIMILFILKEKEDEAKELSKEEVVFENSKVV